MIDDKLKEIGQRLIVETRRGREVVIEIPDEFWGEIKQAFKNEGYIKIPKLVLDKGGKTIALKPDNVMTGQEWCDRFMDEAEQIDLNSKTRWHEIIEAARKAAGLV